MKKYLLSLFILFLFLGCNSDNDYDAQNGLISGGIKDDTALTTLYEKVYRTDANSSYEAIISLVESLKNLNQTQNQINLQEVQTKFKLFVLEQKKLEATFLADVLNDNFLDTLGYMEYFHSGKNSDLVSELNAIFRSQTNLAEALYKNSNKSITSLEYTLFGEDENISSLLNKMDERRSHAGLLMGEKIATYSKLIKDFYINDESFLNSMEVSTSELLNQLIDSSYKLKEWRIGEATGIVKKYEGIIDKKKLEYYKSNFSIDAIIMILQTHLRILQNGLKSIASSAGATTQADAIEQTLQTAITLCKSFHAPLEDSLNDTKVKDLYNIVNVLQQEYTALIASMNFTQKIIEADGD